ncbi:MAG TPA: hypothetical protein VGN81_35075 [Pseudonocardiaceae bacterium]
MTEDGILSAGGPGNWWAWAGVRLAPAQAPSAPAPPVSPDPGPVGGQHFSGSAHTVLQSRDIHGNVVVNVGAQDGAPPNLVPWLGALWQHCVAVGASVELRLLNNADRTLSAYLLCRVAAPDQSLALAAAARLRDTLPSGLPRSATSPVLDQTRLSTVLTPFAPHQHGIVEIRKRLTAAHRTRRDAAMPVLAAVTPLDGGTSWPEMWAALAAFPAPALLSVRLQPFRVGPGLLSRLELWSTEFARLAVPGVPVNPTWPDRPPPDRFAVHAAPLYAAALRRYTELAFEIRVSLASSSAMSNDAAQLLANTISPARPGAGFAGDAPVIVRPRTPEHTNVAWRNITVLSADPIGPIAPEGFPDDSIGDVARALTTIADIHEAAAVFRPPYPIEGSSTRFAD